MYFDDYSKELSDTLAKISKDQLGQLFGLIDEARKNGKRVFILGNGGSAAAASHWVCDFGKGINVGDSRRLKIMALSDDTSIYSAYGNDCGQDTTMTEQLKNFLEEGDLVISLSVSGNSSNLLTAHKYAKENGAKTVCVVGDYKGKLIDLSDLAIVIESKNYGVVEDVHLILNHALSQEMKRENLREQGA